ncbi:TPA: thioesterase [bacterium UBP9_UBA11836]|nr:thioesterase [bacterium UBP9_UBA11836]
MEIKTHLGIDKQLCGQVVQLGEGEAVVNLTLTQNMSADVRGLVHGGFIFGLADYAAMLAVNDPNVVLGAAETRFLKPCQVGEIVEAHAKVVGEAGKKRIVEVSCKRGDVEVFKGSFTCFVLDKHVLD